MSRSQIFFRITCRKSAQRKQNPWKTVTKDLSLKGISLSGTHTFCSVTCRKSCAKKTKLIKDRTVTEYLSMRCISLSSYQKTHGRQLQYPCPSRITCRKSCHKANITHIIQSRKSLHLKRYVQWQKGACWSPPPPTPFSSLLV